MKSRVRLDCHLAGLLALICISVRAQDAAAPLIQELSIPLEKVEGRIDHMTADVAGQRVFVAALGNNTVEVVDLKAG